jgi:hypothetical protein
MNIAGDVVIAVLLAIAAALVIDKLRPRKRKRLTFSIDIEE